MFPLDDTNTGNQFDYSKKENVTLKPHFAFKYSFSYRVKKKLKLL